MQHSVSEPHCSEEQLQRVLADSLSEPEEHFVAAHLSVCDQCRQQLESLAADDDTWTRAALWLSSEASPAPKVSAPSGTAIDEEDAFDADFAVQFLSPCDSAGSIGRLDDIEIREIIGRGAMGIVLKGWQQELNRFVAIKVMSPYLAVSTAARRRFEREAQAAAAILHPNVMPIHSVSSTARLPYLVMPYMACESLQQRLDREGSLPLIEQLQIAVQVARGLAAAHAQGLVHRDVKPANILLERGVDRVMLTDFGLARAVDDASLTRSGVIAGTPQYMSPEQARGDAIDQRSDLFSFGSVMYAMAAGRAPFRAESSYGILRRLCETSPRSLRDVNSDAPEWLAVLIERLHARERDSRIQSASEIAEILEQCLAHVRQPNACALPQECLRNHPRTVRATVRRASFFVGALLVVALLAATVPGMWSKWDQSQSTPSGTSSVPSSDSVSGEPITPSRSLEWDDGSEEALEEISQRINGLESELMEDQ
jgi:serine/threonine protein kinase